MRHGWLALEPWVTSDTQYARDGGYDAHWLAQREVEPTASDGNRLAAEFGDRAGVILKHARAQGRFIARVADRLADVQGFELRNFLEVLAEFAGNGVQNRFTFAGRDVAPT